MILILHIIIALTSCIYTIFLAFFPTKIKLNISYGLLALTVGSGTYLILTKPVHILTTCIEGLAFIGFVVSGIVIARKRLTTQQEEI